MQRKGFKLGKAPFFNSIQEKKVSVQESYLFEVPDSPPVERDWNTPLEIDPGCLLVVAGEEDFYKINILKPGLGY